MEFLEQSSDVALVIADAEFLLDDQSDAGAGPYLTAKAVGFRAVPEELGDQPLLCRGQSRNPTRSGMRAKCLDTAPLSERKPTADSRGRDVECLSDLPLSPAFLLQAQRPHPTPFLPIPVRRKADLHASFYGRDELTSVRADQ